VVGICGLNILRNFPVHFAFYAPTLIENSRGIRPKDAVATVENRKASQVKVLTPANIEQSVTEKMSRSFESIRL